MWIRQVLQSESWKSSLRLITKFILWSWRCILDCTVLRMLLTCWPFITYYVNFQLVLASTRSHMHAYNVHYYWCACITLIHISIKLSCFTLFGILLLLPELLIFDFLFLIMILSWFKFIGKLSSSQVEWNKSPCEDAGPRYIFRSRYHVKYSSKDTKCLLHKFILSAKLFLAVTLNLV